MLAEGGFDVAKGGLDITKAQAWKNPIEIDKVEWFATAPRECCRVMARPAPPRTQARHGASF